MLGNSCGEEKHFEGADERLACMWCVPIAAGVLEWVALKAAETSANGGRLSHARQFLWGRKAFGGSR
jgi:hypothetical protein